MRLTLTALALAGSAVAMPQLASAAEITPGVYALNNHPDGNASSPGYGLRLDELFDFTPDAKDIITFDFDREGATMRLEYDGSSVRIRGRAFGGLDVGSDYSEDPTQTSWVTIDFTYFKVEPVAGDDDIKTVPDDFVNSGSITWENTGEVIGLWDFSGDHDYTFRLGDGDSDNGHRGFDGISGWGWLDHGAPGTHVYASDWLFSATPIPVPPAALLGAAGILGLPITRRLRRRAQRVS
ncbi:MAG: hypothetical protein AAF432_01020 [Planctomycetota bacterium]